MAERPEQDLREAQRRPQGRPPTDDRGGRVDDAGSALAEKIRELRKAVRRRRAKQRAADLKKTRDRRRKTKGLREAKDEVNQLVSRARSAVGAASSPGVSASRAGAGARGTRDVDPAERAGREAESPAPVNASLRPFGPPQQGVGPEQLERLAGGGPQEARDARREERGLAPLEEFAASDAFGEDPDDSEESGLVRDDDVGFVFGGGDAR